MKTISPLLLILVGLSFPTMTQSKIQSKQKVVIETKAERVLFSDRRDKTTPSSSLFVEFDSGSRKPLAEYTAAYRGAEVSKDCRDVIFEEYSDSNGDGVVTFADAAGGFIAALDGSHKQQLWKKAGAFSLSPDGKQVAFRSEKSGTGEVWTIAINGGSERQITKQARWAGHVNWSPDGRWIAFYSSDDKGSYATVVKPDGSGFRRVSPNVGNGWEIDWTVDGNLVFPIEVAPGRRRMHSVKPDGTGLRDITGTTIRVENRLRCGWPQEDKGPLKES